MDARLNIEGVQRAAHRLAGVAHRTPILTSQTLDAVVGASVYLKVEGFQRAGAFKFRGAYNAVASLNDATLRRGVCAASSGNHAQALALAANLCGTRATILMPDDAPPIKRAATEGYGAEVITFDRYSEDREELMEGLSAERGMHVVHPYDDSTVIAGAGTVALELIDEIGELDAVLVPLGGGGLIAGCATAFKALSPRTRVLGVEPEACAAAVRSKALGRRARITVRPTIADGLQLATPGALTWPVIDELVDDLLTVSDDEIARAMALLFDRLKVIAEPSAAIALAALLGGGVEEGAARVAVILSGSNIDARRLAAILADAEI